MSLDDLFTEEAEPRAAPPALGRFTVRAILGILTVAAVAGFAGHQALSLAGYTVPYPLLAGGLAAGLFAQKITAAAHGDRLAEAEPPVPPPYPAPDDRAYQGAQQWIARLGADRHTFRTQTWPAIVAVVDERLRLRHGVDRQRDPQRARALLGDHLWRFVTTPPARPLRPRQARRLVQQISQL